MQDSGIVIVADSCREQMRLPAVDQNDSGGRLRVSIVRLVSFLQFSSVQ